MDAKVTTFQVSVLRTKQTGQVLFLEAGKDFVDLLLSFLLLPVGTILNMLSTGPVQAKSLGGMSNVFKSVKNLDNSLLQVDKQTLVEPHPAAIGTTVCAGLLRGPRQPSSSKKVALPNVYYRCERSEVYNTCSVLSAKPGVHCPNCGTCHNIAMYVLPKDLQELERNLEESAWVKESGGSCGQGFVKESITYMVTDSLEIMPSTTIRSIKVLNKLKVPTLADLESTEVTVTITQVLQLLHSALISSSCLNEVFGKK